MKGSVEVELDVKLAENGMWPGLREAKGVKVLEGAELGAVWTTEDSTEALGTVVGMRIDLGGGRVAIAEVTLASFLDCAAKVRAYYEVGPKNVTEEQLEKLGKLVDNIDNLVHAGKIPMPDKLRVTALTEALPDLHSELKTLYVEIAGDDPWADIPSDP